VALALFAAAALSVAPVRAEKDKDYGGGEHGKSGYGHGKGYGGHGMAGMGMGGWHGSTSHLLRHMLKHEKEIGLKEDQVAKLKDLQLNLDRTRIKTEADIMVAERELKALVEDEKSDLAAIESKLKQSESMEAGLRLEAIKTRREALAMLTPEQKEKEKAEHEKMMQEHKMPRGEGTGSPHGSDGKRGKGHN
jgi:Spy/CpxP family protein refolding chaperone